jgi:uncharacterized protein (TIGR02996 family)
MTEEAFLLAIRDQLDEETTRLVFADWLEDRGDARAEFVRLDTSLQTMTGDEKEFRQQEERWRELREGLPRGWLEAFGHLSTTTELADAAATFSFPTPPVEYIDRLEFGPEDTLVPSGEISIRITCGNTGNFDSGLEFWLLTLHRELWGMPRCTPLTEASWRKAFVQHSSFLRQPLSPSAYRGEVPFVAALHLEAAWNSQGWLAAYRDVYIALLWETTA